MIESQECNFPCKNERNSKLNGLPFCKVYKGMCKCNKSELNKNSESSKEGSVISNVLVNEIIQYITSNMGSSEMDQGNWILEQLTIRANGESPEEDNPVTQTQLEKEVTDYLTNNNIHYRIVHNTIDIIKGNLNRIQMSKVRTTDKEQPTIGDVVKLFDTYFPERIHINYRRSLNSLRDKIIQLIG